MKQMAIYGSLLARQSDFTKFVNITEKSFLENIDTGDILLFRSNDMLAPWLTRTFTQSNFDHVGLILRFGDTVSDVYILEAVGDSGVRMTSWLSARQFLGGFFNKIAYRKLQFDITEEKLKALDKFRRNITGK